MMERTDVRCYTFGGPRGARPEPQRTRASPRTRNIVIVLVPRPRFQTSPQGRMPTLLQAWVGSNVSGHPLWSRALRGRNPNPLARRLDRTAKGMSKTLNAWKPLCPSEGEGVADRPGEGFALPAITLRTVIKPGTSRSSRALGFSLDFEHEGRRRGRRIPRLLRQSQRANPAHAGCIRPVQTVWH
jgi:hypothetical protein